MMNFDKRLEFIDNEHTALRMCGSSQAKKCWDIKAFYVIVWYMITSLMC